MLREASKNVTASNTNSDTTTLVNLLSCKRYMNHRVTYATCYFSSISLIYKKAKTHKLHLYIIILREDLTIKSGERLCRFRCTRDQSQGGRGVLFTRSVRFYLLSSFLPYKCLGRRPIAAAFLIVFTSFIRAVTKGGQKRRRR